MARKIKSKCGVTLWILEHCEEVVVVNAWLSIKGKIPPHEHWTADFEHNFFDSGGFFRERHQDSFNRHLRKVGVDELYFDETNATDYIRQGTKDDHRKNRCHILERLLEMDAKSRSKYVDSAIASKEALEPAHRTYEEYCEAFRRSEPPQRTIIKPPLSSPVPAQQSEPVSSTPPKIPVEIAIKLLDHTTDATLKNQLIRGIIEAFAA